LQHASKIVSYTLAPQHLSGQTMTGRHGGSYLKEITACLLFHRNIRRKILAMSQLCKGPSERTIGAIGHTCLSYLNFYTNKA